MSRARALVAPACCCSICSSHWNRWSAKSALDLFHVDRGGPMKSVIPTFVHFARFFAPSEPAAPFVVCTSHESSHGVVHLSIRSCSHSMRIRVRRPDAWRTAISVAIRDSFSPSPRSHATRVPKVNRGRKQLTVSAIICDKAAMLGERYLLGAYSDRFEFSRQSRNL